MAKGGQGGGGITMSGRRKRGRRGGRGERKIRSFVREMNQLRSTYLSGKAATTSVNYTLLNKNM